MHGKHITRGLVGLLLAAALGLSALAAGVSVEPTPDYTRLYFQFDQPAKLQLGGGGKDVILTFDQPVKQNMLGLQPQLETIANGIQQSADGKQIILNLKKNYRVRQFTSGNSVGVDIMGSMGAPKPAPAVDAKPELVAAAAPVSPVAVVTPPAPQPAAKPAPVKIVTPSEKPAVKVITPETLTQQIKAKPPQPQPEPVAAPKPQAPEAKVIRVEPPSILTTKKDPAAPLPQEGPPQPNVSPAEALGPVADPVTSAQLFGSKPEPEAEPEAPVVEAPVAQVQEPVIAPPTVSTEEKEKAAPAEEVVAEQEEEEPVVVDTDAPFLVGVKPVKDGTELYFPWTERVGAAVFERGSEIWIVFSKEADANVALLRTVLPKSVIKIDQFGYKGATVLRLVTDGKLHAQVSQPKKSYGWRVTLGPITGEATLDIPLSVDKDDNGKSYLLLNAFDVAEPLRFFDPTIGDLLVVIPTNELGRGLVNPKTTAELNVLRTPQGIAIASLRDDLMTRRDRIGIMLSVEGSLAVSENLPVLTASAAPVPGVSAASSVMIPYDQWYVPADEFSDVLAVKLEDLATASESAKPEAAMGLVQLYLGQSLMPEAAGWLEIIQRDYPDYYREHKLAMLSAASYLLSGRVPEAVAAIDAPELQDEPEAALWREAISLVRPGAEEVQLIIEETAPAGSDTPKLPDAASDTSAPPPPLAATEPVAPAPDAIEEEEEEEEVGETAATAPTSTPESTGDLPAAEEVIDAPVAERAITAIAAEPAGAPATAPAAAATPAVPPIKREFNFLNYNKAYIRFYPPRIRQKLAVMAADHYLKSGQPEKAVMAYDTLNQDGILEGVQPYAEYMLGTIATAKGKPKDALKIWDRMSRQHEDPYIRARARYSALMLRMERGELKPLETAEALERLRMSWRGDGLEREMLLTLIKIYRDEKQYDNTLRAMKYLLQSFPGQVDTLTLAGDMSELFEELFLHGMADDMPPLKSLGLFYEFRELTPIGEKGDEIIQKLADRLAAVDLLERATQLLEHQIRYRVSGEARARVGARLSLLYLLNKEPKRAIEVLEITNYGDMESELKLQRTQLTAQALAENERPEEALALLTNDMSEQGSLLRLDILWGMQDWPNVINAAEDLLGNRANLTEPLSLTETPVLLKLALAYAFEEDPTQLRYLRDYYMSLVPEGPYKEIFDYLTNDTAPLDAEDFALVAKQISRTESFLDTFKTKIAQGRLSEVAKEPAAEAPTP